MVGESLVFVFLLGPTFSWAWGFEFFTGLWRVVCIMAVSVANKAEVGCRAYCATYATGLSFSVLPVRNISKSKCHFGISRAISTGGLGAVQLEMRWCNWIQILPLEWLSIAPRFP